MGSRTPGAKGTQTQTFLDRNTLVLRRWGGRARSNRIAAKSTAGAEPASKLPRAPLDPVRFREQVLSTAHWTHECVAARSEVTSFPFSGIRLVLTEHQAGSTLSAQAWPCVRRPNTKTAALPASCMSAATSIAKITP